MTPDQIQIAANALFEAEKSRQQMELISLANPQMTMDDAYAIQSAYVDKKRKNGGKQHGWKIGLTSKAMQSALGIDIPDSGILFEDMFFENGSQIPRDRFIQPRIEAEIAFVMKAPVSGPNITREQVIAATDYVCPSLEILDTRIVRQDAKTGISRKIFDTIADNAANAGIVLGTQKHQINAFDLRWVGAIVTNNDEVEETGLGAGVLNDPVMGIVWLANRLAQYNQSISAGDVVLSGSFIRPVETEFGDHIYADFGPFGHVSCTF
ncbi:2-oxo-hept-4-ene-1,7-dioate hydratase [Maritalea porphyrae]|uniref:2-oxo-hept-4-ene-1,7-dioate hydratase n=1 Tax=Maritalea porphyrae TaxID=880732 RepID=UPI0022B019B8|nr:2-oxo-hepta-3-ene-1,7-dioic acid hydratase [Maritalea porphyrae]MCZ4272808.1 2-oxo-hepta-3-ene-1,7-dioic acid hydratase [Maritalea porphyrae]